MAIGNHITKPGDVILDPFGGTGSIFVMAAFGRIIVATDIEAGYIDMMQRSVMTLQKGCADIDERITILHGDCRKLLPLSCDAIITSPPYANMMVKKHIGAVGKDMAADKKMWRAMGDVLPDYCKDPNNIANLNIFMYNQKMKPIYGLMHKSLKVGGMMCILMKDKVVQHKRVYLTRWIEQVCVREIGFKLVEWHKHVTGGSPFQRFHESRGDLVVKEEDIMIFRREV
jgi:DNA modification methylase